MEMNKINKINEEILEELEGNSINCEICNMEHTKSTSNCCWISCKCGKQICGRCGSTDIQQINEKNLDNSEGSDDNYWCCKMCGKCELNGCGMCV